MEMLVVNLDDGTGKEFDSLVHAKNALPDGGDIKIVTKDHAMTSGKPGCVITWTVKLPDGSLARCQSVTSCKLIQMAAKMIEARYGDLLQDDPRKN